MYCSLETDCAIFLDQTILVPKVMFLTTLISFYLNLKCLLCVITIYAALAI